MSCKVAERKRLSDRGRIITRSCVANFFVFSRTNRISWRIWPQLRRSISIKQPVSFSRNMWKRRTCSGIKFFRPTSDPCVLIRTRNFATEHSLKLHISSLFNISIILICRLNTPEGSEYLFACEQSELKMIEWVDKVNFHAQLDPAQQLTSFNRTVMLNLYLNVLGIMHQNPRNKQTFNPLDLPSKISKRQM